jgi:hypothetical protein
MAIAASNIQVSGPTVLPALQRASSVTILGRVTIFGYPFSPGAEIMPSVNK